MEEVQYTELFPLVPYVFFDEKSSDPNPSTQKMVATREAGSFTIDGLEPDAVKINSYTLDIIGSRMQKEKDSKIKIVGTVDNTNETAKSDLAKKRAEFVKNYLVVNYEIDGWHPDHKAVLEIESGRGWQGNAFYRDLVRTSLVQDAEYLVIGLRLSYSYGLVKNQNDYQKALDQMDAIFASGRLQLPFKGVLIFGW